MENPRFIRDRQKRITRVRKFLYIIFGGKCVYCGVETNLTEPESKRYCTLEHAIPVNLGGEKRIHESNDNLLLACQRCNNKRGSRSFIYFCNQKKYLFE